MGLVSEQIIEWAIVTAATEGAGAAIESGALEARIVKALESAKAFKNSDAVKAIVNGLREAISGGGNAESRATALRRYRSRRGMIALPFGTAIPSVRNGEFYRWFNSLTPKEFSKLWENPRLQGIIKQRLRSPGGFHEWLPVSRAAKFKEWGVTAEQIRDYRTPTGGVRFTKPGAHGGDFSTAAHNEIFRLIDESKDFESFKKALRLWADRNLVGGSGALPLGLR